MRIGTLVLALGISAFGTLEAQDSSRTDWRERSVVGSAQVGLDAYFERVHTDFAPLQTSFWGSATWAPFVTPHWQVGLAPSWATNSSPLGRIYGGSASLTANWFPWDNDRSRPFVGAWVARYGQSLNRPYTGIGGQLGWLQFLSPNLALHAEARYRHIDTPRPEKTGDAFLTLSSYFFGRANQPPVRLPTLGTMDVIMLADYAFHPGHALTLNLLAGPFLTNWLQVGGASDIDFFFDESTSDRYFEGFARGYVPVSARFAPFVQLYADRFTVGTSSTISSRGAEVGVRDYLAPGLALDVTWEWRNFSDDEPEQRLLRARLRSQIRVARH